MAPASVHNKPTKNRRRKKRRTEDFSSDSDSDSDSSASEPETKPTTEGELKNDASALEINVDDMDISSDTEEVTEESDLGLSKEIEEQIRNIQFTSTKNQTPAEAKETIKRDRQELESKYLAYMANTFSDDLDELRKKPDFTSESLVILAKTLQLGANMFDSETLDALLKE